MMVDDACLVDLQHVQSHLLTTMCIHMHERDCTQLADPFPSEEQHLAIGLHSMF